MEALAGKLPLTETARDIVPAEGSPEAEVMFIGEAAGYHESVQRRPFVGAAGKLLTRVLAGNGLARDKVWISNMVKSRPPGNRDPKPEEIEAFRPFLDREIEIIKPKIIVTLGRFSMAKFLGELVKIGQVHGQARWVELTLPAGEKFRTVALPMYHPAAALRSGSIMAALGDDFRKLPSILAKIGGKNGTIKAATAKDQPSVSSAGEETGKQLSLI